MEVKDDPQVTAFISPELSYLVYPNRIVTTSKEFRILFIEPEPLLRILISRRPRLLYDKDAFVIG